MLSIHAISNAQGYAIYLEKEGIIGEWLGSGARSLGLVGEVLQKEYRPACRGEHPATGEYLLPIHRAERLDTRRTERLRELGKITEADVIKYFPREAYGLVLSSPKTVSIQGLCDKRMLECHEHGVASTVQELERISGGLVIAAYQHRNSRRNDPLIHTHLVVMNMRLKEGGWKSLDAIWIYKNKEHLTGYFEREVLCHAERLGYEVDYPHLAGIPDEVFDKFSQRSGERDDAIHRHKEKHGLGEETQLSDRQIAALVYHNRGPKQILPRDQVQEMQIAKLTPSERIALRETVERSYEHAHRHRLRLEIAEGEENTPAHRLTYGQRISM
jgi:conjugative relaxase-like TrwC/TraI family protein